MATRLNSSTSALAALSASEKATVLDELLASRVELRQLAERLAVRLLRAADRTAVADQVAGGLQDLDVEELNGHAGYRPGRGYVHPGEAADEILDEVLEPFLGDLERRAALGMAAAATELAMVSYSAGTGVAMRSVKRSWSTPRTTPPSGLRTSWTGARNSTSTCLMTSLLIS